MKRGDWVICKGFPEVPGIITRVARDGSWADVEFPSWSKRMRTAVLEVREQPDDALQRLMDVAAGEGGGDAIHS